MTETANQVRRRMLSVLALGGAAGAVGVASVAAAAQSGGATPASAPSRVAVPKDGKFASVALRRESLRVTAVQSRMRSPRDLKNPAREIKANVDHMCELIDYANGGTIGATDLVCFHEQPIMGYNPWTREQALRVAIEVPGPETEAIGKKAAEHGCYVSFGTYSRDEEWPGHLLLTGVLIGPSGKVVANHWKPNNVRGSRPGWEMFTTSIYDVLEQYRERYGEDAVLPVARTDIGNLNCSVAPYQPDLYRALALKGTEIAIRASSGGYLAEDALMTARYNQIYMVVCNNAVSPEHPGYPEYAGAGDSAIYGPSGALSKARSYMEEFVRATLPLAEFRKTHSVPEVPKEMLAPVYDAYVPRYGPNLLSDHLPKDTADAAKYFGAKRKW